jgi:hypothetical protein
MKDIDTAIKSFVLSIKGYDVTPEAEQQLKQSIYEWVKGELEKEKVDISRIEPMPDNKFYQLHTIRNQTITDCLESIRKGLNVTKQNK